jgi:hypothetical protein
MRTEVYMADKRRDGTTRGGQELPDDVQDRPEQNAGYDAAVSGNAPNTPNKDVVSGSAASEDDEAFAGDDDEFEDEDEAEDTDEEEEEA